MKQPKKLTRNQKELLVKKKLNPAEYMAVNEGKGFLIIISKVTKQTVTLLREG